MFFKMLVLLVFILYFVAVKSKGMGFKFREFDVDLTYTCFMFRIPKSCFRPLNLSFVSQILFLGRKK